MKLKIGALAAALPPTHSFHGSRYNVILFLSCMLLHGNSEIHLHRHIVSMKAAGKQILPLQVRVVELSNTLVTDAF